MKQVVDSPEWKVFAPLLAGRADVQARFARALARYVAKTAEYEAARAAVDAVKAAILRGESK